MAADSKKSPALIRRMIDLHAQGGSAREIAETLGLGHQTILRWLREQGRTPNGTQPRRDTRERTTPAANVDSLVADAEREVAELDGRAPGPAPLRNAENRLTQIRKTLDARYDDMLAGTFPPATYNALAKLEMQYSTLVAQLAPAPTADERNAAATAESLDRMMAKLHKLIAEEQAICRCLHCGRHPFSGAHQ